MKLRATGSQANVPIINVLQATKAIHATTLVKTANGDLTVFPNVACAIIKSLAIKIMEPALITVNLDTNRLYASTNAIMVFLVTPVSCNVTANSMFHAIKR